MSKPKVILFSGVDVTVKTTKIFLDAVSINTALSHEVEIKDGDDIVMRIPAGAVAGDIYAWKGDIDEMIVSPNASGTGEIVVHFEDIV